MGTEVEDLWPELDATGIVTPSSLLKDQAVALTRKTDGVVRGEVESWSRERDIYHRLDLVVPALDDYHFALLLVHHSATLFPVYVDDGPDVFSPDHPKGRSSMLDSRVPVLSDQAEFKSWLARALASEETKRILQSLLAQATH